MPASIVTGCDKHLLKVELRRENSTRFTVVEAERGLPESDSVWLPYTRTPHSPDCGFSQGS